ncbi:MAG: phosphatase PAP2 family protein [Bacteroidota bacterium]|nr:phosphatase PAP2 family protein [Bacteroidota bacterium]
MFSSSVMPAGIRSRAFTLTALLFITFISTLYSQTHFSEEIFWRVTKRQLSVDSAGFRETLLGDLERSVYDAERLNPCEVFRGGKRLNIAGSAFGVCLIAYAADESLRDAARRNVRNTRTAPLVMGEAYGSVWTGAGIGCALYGTGLVTGDRLLRETGREALTALLYTGILTSVLKSLTGRSRPARGEGARMFRPFRFDAGHTAFPSGHSAVAFTVTSVLARRIGHPFVTTALYALALFTAVQRVGSDSHWTSDTFAGAFLGWAVGSLVSQGTDGDTVEVDLGMEVLPPHPGEYAVSLRARVPLPLGGIVSGSR